MSKAKKYILLCAIILTCLFSTSFLAFDRYLNNKKQDIEEENRAALAKKMEKSLDDSIIVTLFKGDVKEQETTLGKLKKELSISHDLNVEELSSILSGKGYTLDGVYDKEIVYRRNIKDGIEPNMYYIGECEGFIAIYTSDENGNLTISNPSSDIIKEGKKFKDLTKNDQQMIKNNELKCKTKEEAEERISELVS